MQKKKEEKMSVSQGGIEPVRICPHAGLGGRKLFSRQSVRQPGDSRKLKKQPSPAGDEISLSYQGEKKGQAEYREETRYSRQHHRESTHTPNTAQGKKTIETRKRKNC